MPTAAKLVAALAWAALAWWASELIKPYFAVGQGIDRFSEVNAVLGLVFGWRMAGRHAGQGWGPAISHGLTTTVALVVTAVVLYSCAEMLRRSLRGFVKGPAEAFVDVFRNLTEFFVLVAQQDVIVTLAVGGILAGLVTEWTGRRLR